MTYHQFPDLVMTPDGEATVIGLWPDRTLVMVRLKSGRTRSYDRHQVTAVRDVLQTTLEAIDSFFEIPDAREEYAAWCDENSHPTKEAP